MSDFLFRGSLAKLDPETYELTQLEQERQYKKLILIPSEFDCPDGHARSAGISLSEHLCRRLSRRRIALDERRGNSRLPGAAW